MTNPTTMAQAYDALDAMTKAGSPLDGAARNRFLANARAGKIDFGQPTDAQRIRFNRGHAHGGRCDQQAAAEITRQVRAAGGA